MTLPEAIQILKTHNVWRRGAETGQANPTQLGIAIDTVVDEYEQNTCDEWHCVKCGKKYIPHLMKPLTICDACFDKL